MKRLLFGLSVIGFAMALDNGVGLTPPMGWNSWRAYGCSINETVLMQNAQWLVQLGLKDLGYNYVNLDDCWSLPQRSGDHIQPDPAKFTNTIQQIAAQIHEKELRFGLFSAAGSQSCVSGAGSFSYEQIDANDFAQWGIDYLKYADCNGFGLDASLRFKSMRDALNKTGKPIYFSLSKALDDLVYDPSMANSWRTSVKVRDGWSNLKSNFFFNTLYQSKSQTGAWNDPDLLDSQNLSIIEQKTQFTLWALIKAPLLISVPLNQLTSQQLQILKNKQLISVNQDKTSSQAKCLFNCQNMNGVQVYGGPQNVRLPGGQEYYALAIVNFSDLYTSSTAIDFQLIEDIVCLGCISAQDVQCDVYDMWGSATYKIGTYTNVFTPQQLKPHESQAYRLKCKYLS